MLGRPLELKIPVIRALGDHTMVRPRIPPPIQDTIKSMFTPPTRPAPQFSIPASLNGKFRRETARVSAAVATMAAGRG